MAKISSEFLKELQGPMCGSAAFTEDDPWCAANPEPIEFDDYLDGTGTKYLDILPTWEEDAVRFCRQFGRTPELFDEARRCTPLGTDVATELNRIIAALPGPSGTTPPAAPLDAAGTATAPVEIPTPSQIYVLLRRTQLPPQSFDDLFRARAQSIHDQLQRIAQLKKAGDPGLDAAVMDLQEKLSHVCVVSDPEALRKINDACGRVIATHDNMKTWYQKGIAAITGLGGSIWLSIKMGWLPKMWTAGKNQWKASRTIDPKTKKPVEGKLMAALKTIGAFFRMRDPYAPQQPQQPQYPYPGPYGPYNGPYIPPYTPPTGQGQQPPPGTSPGAGGAMPPTAGSSTPWSPSYPTGSLQVPIEGISQADTGLIYTDDMRVSELRQTATAVITAFDHLAQHPQSSAALSERATVLRESLERTAYIDDRSALVELMPLIMDEKTLGSFEAFIESYTRWIATERFVTVAALAKRGLGELAEDETAELQTILEEANEAIGTIRTSATEIGYLINHLGTAIGRMEEVFSVTAEQRDRHIKLLKRWTAGLQDAGGLMHDVNNVTQRLEGNIQLAHRRLDRTALVQGHLEDLSQYDLSNLRFTLDFVTKLHRRFAEERQVEIRVGDAAELMIPDEGSLRFDLFRIVNELVTNAIKYANPAETAVSYVEVRTEREGDLLRIIVEDNGVGISDVEKVLASGVREQPELAEGDGEGLTIVQRLTQEHGVAFRIESTVGQGSRITLEKNISGWTPSPGGGSTNGTAGAGSDGEMPIGGSASIETHEARDIALGRSRFAGFADVEQSSDPMSDAAIPFSLLQDDATNPLGIETPGAIDAATGVHLGTGVFVGVPSQTARPTAASAH